jgi:pilus assembly protein CpaB
VLAGKNPLLIAVALGVLAGGVAWAAIRSRDQEVRERWRTVQVLCAKVDVVEGAELEQEMIAVREIPARFVTASYIQADADGTPQGESPVGQRVLAPLKAGDPILASMLSTLRETELATLIHPRGRAVSIDVQERSAVGLWVRPNDHVDVIGSFRDPQSQQLRTMTLLQNVVVLATGRITANALSVPDEEKRFSTVTLLTLPEEAEMLTLAQDLGTLTLLLRNPDDLDSQEKRNVVDQKTLFAGERASELQQKRYRTIQIIRGNRSGAAPPGGEP